MGEIEYEPPFGREVRACELVRCTTSRLIRPAMPVNFHADHPVPSGCLLGLIVSFAVFAAQSLAVADSNIAYPVDELDQLLQYGEPNVTGVEGARFEKCKGFLQRSDGQEIQIKVRAARPREEYNNIPRYDMAAYRLQTLFLEPDDYVVTPTSIRAIEYEIA